MVEDVVAESEFPRMTRRALQAALDTSLKLETPLLNRSGTSPKWDNMTMSQRSLPPMLLESRPLDLTHNKEVALDRWKHSNFLARKTATVRIISF